MQELILLIFMVVFASALCSCSEAAIFSVPSMRAQFLARSKGRAGLVLQHIKANMARPIATIVILNNIANIVGSMLVERLAKRELDNPFLLEWVLPIALVTIVIIFAEIIPKTMGERFAESIALLVAIPLRALSVLFTPIIYLLELLTRPFGKATFRPSTSEDEIKLLAHVGQHEGVIEARESTLIQRVFSLNDSKAVKLMTPRIGLTYLNGDLTLQEAKERILESQHSRILITGEDLDDVLGIALKDELLGAMVNGENGRLSRYCKPVRAVPEGACGDKLLDLFRQTRQHLFLVIDEYGGTAGVVTLEDVLEVLAGKIQDETDRDFDPKALARKKAYDRIKKKKPRSSEPSDED